jgi:glycosyltransferase involved in cell wall biosynthesis
MPLVSVIIPAFRAHATIARAVDSLRAQPFADWEAIIVADDGDDYRPALAADPRLRFVSTGTVGSGPAAARNRGLDAASGRLVAPLDADDAFDPLRLATLVPLALAHGAASSNVRVVDDASGVQVATLFPPVGDAIALDAAGFLATSVPMMFVAERGVAGRWDDDVFLCDDLPYNLRLFDRLGRVPVTRQPLYDYRVREGSICHSTRSGEWAEQGYTTVLRRLAADGLGIASPSIRAMLADAVGQKRDLNRAFEAARRRGEVANFQEFIAGRGHVAAAGVQGNSA